MSEKFTMRSARQFRKASVEDVASAVGVKVATIYMWEEGKTSPPVDKALKMCDYLGIPLDGIDWRRDA